MSSSSWESLSQMAKKFWDDLGDNVRNIMSVDRIVETQDVATEKLKAIQIEINKISGSRHKTGDPKLMESAERKAKTDYNGDLQRVTDFARGKQVVTGPDQIKAIEELLDDSRSEFSREHDICLVSKQDYFSNPKENTGYRCINYKLAIPVGEDENGDTERQVVELQIVASQIERINGLTHPFKRRAEDIVARATDSEEEMSPEEALEVHLCFATCRFYNGLISRNNDYDALLEAGKGRKFALTPARQEHLFGDLRNLRELDRKRDDLSDYMARQEAPLNPSEIKAGLNEEGHWIGYGIYRPVNQDPEFFRVTKAPSPQLHEKPLDELEEADYVFKSIQRWDFEEAEWVSEQNNLKKMNSDDFSDRYKEADFHERMLRHESTLTRRYFEQSGILDAKSDAGRGLNND